MTYYDKKDNGFCCLCFSGITFIVMAMLLIQQTTNMKLYEETLCVYRNKSYPTELSQTDKFVSCDCGKRCTSSTACGNIYVNYLDEMWMNDNTTTIPTRKYVNPMYSKCSFYEEHCDEDLESILEEMNNIQKQVDAFETNKPFRCYRKKGIEHPEYAYKENNFDMTQLIVYSSFMGVIVLIWFCCACYNDRKLRNKKETKKDVEEQHV